MRNKCSASAGMRCAKIDCMYVYSLIYHFGDEQGVRSVSTKGCGTFCAVFVRQCVSGFLVFRILGLDNMLRSKPFYADGEVLIAASVATGLENVAADEIREKISVNADKDAVIPRQGRVYFKARKESLPSIHNLRSVDRLYLIVNTSDNYVYLSKEESFLDLKKLAHELHWSEVIKFWFCNLKYDKGKLRQEDLSKRPLHAKRLRLENEISDNTDKNSHSEIASTEINQDTDNHFTEVKGNTIKNESSEKKDGHIPVASPDGTVVKFRVSTNRVGKKQPITSPEASYQFGGEIQDITKWKVDLSNYNLEIMLCLGESSLEVAVALTLQSLHRRNITHFGMTTLRATTAYSMLKLCNIQAGDVIIDPMCGSGAIPVEGSLEWPAGFHIGGDNTNAALTRFNDNIKYLNENTNFGAKISDVPSHRKSLPVDCIRWDVTDLPFKSCSADVVISDLPFGKRVGSKADNRKLYPALLKELARITIPETGRACLLTQDRRTITHALGALSELWRVKKTLFINIGGLIAGIFLLKRTINPYQEVEATSQETS